MGRGSGGPSSSGGAQPRRRKQADPAEEEVETNEDGLITDDYLATMEGWQQHLLLAWREVRSMLEAEIAEDRDGHCVVMMGADGPIKTGDYRTGVIDSTKELLPPADLFARLSANAPEGLTSLGLAHYVGEKQDDDLGTGPGWTIMIATPDGAMMVSTCTAYPGGTMFSEPTTRGPEAEMISRNDGQPLTGDDCYHAGLNKCSAHLRDCAKDKMWPDAFVLAITNQGVVSRDLVAIDAETFDGPAREALAAHLASDRIDNHDAASVWTAFNALHHCPDSEMVPLEVMGFRSEEQYAVDHLIAWMDPDDGTIEWENLSADEKDG